MGNKKLNKSEFTIERSVYKVIYEIIKSDKCYYIMRNNDKVAEFKTLKEAKSWLGVT